MSDKKPNFGRAFNACINTEWAITEEGYRTVLRIASRLNDAQAVEAYREQPLEKTETVKIRSGVAIIPVIGPIFRYANWFTYFSGGSTVSALSRDFRAALENPEVYSIMFEMNTPGGEVTGINELAKMIYAARKKKPMTSRVGGLMCSAGLWLGVMAGDVVIDETAQVGSLGVCTAYIDDRKALEMRGLEELEFISSQSPYKNAPAYTEEGKKRIQARLDALCNIFGEAVALGRGVPVSTVWKKFGQGDVFVGQDAIDAGLADRFGSYEDTIHLLAKAHTPGFAASAYQDDEEEEFISPSNEDASSTINAADAVDSFPDEAEEASPINTEENQSQTEEEIMSKETQENQNSAEEPNAEKTALAAENNQAASDLEAREKELIRRENALKDKEAAAARAEADAKAAVRRTGFEKVAEKFAGDQANKVSLMEKLADSFGEDSFEFKSYVEDQTALAAQIEEGGLFSEAGKANLTGENSAAEKLDRMAKDRAKADGITYEKAYVLVMTENKSLYAEYEAQQSNNPE